MDAADLVSRAGCRKGVQNPFVAAWLDFKTDIRAALGCGGGGFVAKLLSAAARAKLSADWPNGMDFVVNSVEDEHLSAVAKYLGKLWPTGGPEWIHTLRDRSYQNKAARAAAKAAEASAAAAASVPAASAAGAPAASAGALVASTADAPAAADAAAIAPGGSRCASVASDSEFSVGDIVRLDCIVAKKFVGEDAQVTSVGLKTLVVDIISGKSMPKGKTYKHSQCILVQKRSAAPKTGRKTPVEQEATDKPEDIALEPAKNTLNEELSGDAAKNLAASMFELD